MTFSFSRRALCWLAVLLTVAVWTGRAGADETWISDGLLQPASYERGICDPCEPCGDYSRCISDTRCCCDTFVPMMIGAASPAPPRMANRIGGGYAYAHRDMGRIADNNSPLPQDRIAFSYNLLAGAPKTAGVSPTTMDISRFDLLMEKTLLDGAVSVGVNAPFSHTYSSYQVSAAGYPIAEGTELGNVSLTLKGLLWSRPRLKISGGVLVETPTSDDLTFDMLAYKEILKQNRWYLSPFLAALATPTDRLFCQGFISYRDTTGPEDVVMAGARMDPLRDPDLLMVDGGLGYWLYRSPCCHGLTGVVPTLELHYLTTTTDTDGASGVVDRRNDYLYLTGGATARFGRRSTVALGCAVPLRDNSNPYLGTSDRLYDWQLAVQLNYFCGP